MLLLFAAAIPLAGCGSKQSMLTTHSPQAHNIALLWWWMLAAAAIVFFGAMALLGLAWLTRSRAGLPFLVRREGRLRVEFNQRDDVGQGLVLIFGIAIPVVALVVLFGASNVYLIDQTSPPNPQTTPLTVQVIGHQWWWEVRYPGTSAVTANEIHIPVNTRVNVLTTTADVIHSFWVPALNRKIDMVPGMHNRVLLDATKLGRYRGQCSQFCGFQHANMVFYVDVEPPRAFRTWLAATAISARRPRTKQLRAGRRLFMTSQCASCHQVRGTSAHGTVGPDLTHLAARATLAAGTIPNDPAELTSWILHPQSVKPGTRMPDLGLKRSEVLRIVGYLDTLK